MLLQVWCVLDGWDGAGEEDCAEQVIIILVQVEVITARRRGGTVNGLCLPPVQRTGCCVEGREDVEAAAAEGVRGSEPL